MTYLALDIATVTGWVFFNNDVLVEKGSIHIPSTMTLPQRINYFYLELKQLTERLHPEYCFIEDIIMGISGVKTVSYLSRLNGVAINVMYMFLQDNLKLYTPTHWKAKSFPTINGRAKKWEIQRAALIQLNIPVIGVHETIQSLINKKTLDIQVIQIQMDELRDIIQKSKSKLISKKNPVNDDDKIQLTNTIKESEKILLNLKKNIKLIEKDYDKKFIKVSSDIAAQTGITTDIADACGIAYCGYLEYLQEH